MYVELGKVVGVWGVKGWVKIHSYTRDRADIGQYKYWYLQAPRPAAKITADTKANSTAKPTANTTAKPTAMQVLVCRVQGQGIVAQLEGVDDRDQASALSGHVILVKQADLPKLPDGEFYWHQLIGLVVSNETTEIGKISSILETGANDVLVCKNLEQGKPDVLIPYIGDVVKVVDIEQGTMVVDWDPRFLDD